MLFALGIIAGLVIATFVAVVLAYFKRPLVSTLSSVEVEISNAGPRLSGSIYIPMDEADVVREEIVAKNREKGRDTPISELQ